MKSKSPFSNGELQKDSRSKTIIRTAVITATKVLITGLLFYLIFNKIDFRAFGATLARARPVILVTGFVVLWAGHYICIFRWRMLMRPLMPVLSLNRLFGIYCIGLFFNLAFPTLIGGDAVKMYYAGRPSRSYSQSFAATFLDRDAGMLAMMIIACSVIMARPVAVPGVPVSFIVWSAFIAFVLINVAIFAPDCHRLLTSVLGRLQMPGLVAKVDMIANAFQIMGRHRSVLLGSLMISFVNQLLVIAVTWVFALGLQINLPPTYFLLFVPVITLISMIPISLNGMGLREYAFMSLFGAVGVPPESCIALGLLSSVVIIVSSLPGGLVYIFFRNRNDRHQMSALDAGFSSTS